MDKLSKFFKKEFDTELVYNDKHIKTEINLYYGKVSANFHGNKISEDSAHCACLLVMLLDAIVQIHKICYRHIQKYFQNNKNM